ncbi:MAG: hypothetical protein HYU59_11220 [Magnetospirillum gryphiswaldense]|nr:hypothetical protein [Magnetospirillum gryphiswaldense]
MAFGRLWFSLKRRLGIPAENSGDDPRVEIPRGIAAIRASLPRSRRTGFLNEQAFAAELVEFKQDGEGPRLHVISLSDFRQAVGPKWDRLQGLVEVAFDTIIRRHVDINKDVFTRLNGDIACLALPDANRSDARTRVANIAQDLGTHLFGDGLVDGRRPQVLAANLSLDEALTAEGGMDHKAIERALAQSAAAVAAEAVKAKAPPAKARAGAVFAISGQQAAKLEEPDWFLPDQSPLRGADAPRPVMRQANHLGGADAKPAPTWFDDAVKHLRGADAERQVMRIENAPQGGGASGFSSESNLTMVWTPTWVTGRNEVAAFHARILRTDTVRGPTREGVHAYDGLVPIEVLTLDRFSAFQTAHELKHMHYTRQRMGLTVPVHWTSLSPKSRDFIRMPYEECPPDARRRLLKMEIFGLSPAVPQAILSRMFAPLEGLGCDVLVRLSLAAPEMISQLPSARAVGVDLAELADDERVGDAELFQRLDIFRQTARQNRKACYVWGVRRRPLIVQLVKAGFSLVNGPGIMCDLAHPVLPTKAAQ